MIFKGSHQPKPFHDSEIVKFGAARGTFYSRVPPGLGVAMPGTLERGCC